MLSQSSIVFSHFRVEIPVVTNTPVARENHDSGSSVTPGSSKYNVLDDGTLMIQNASGEDEGEYECMARNAVGEAVTRAVSLRYFGAPSKSNIKKLKTSKYYVQDLRKVFFVFLSSTCIFVTYDRK